MGSDYFFCIFQSHLALKHCCVGIGSLHEVRHAGVPAMSLFSLKYYKKIDNNNKKNNNRNDHELHFILYSQQEKSISLTKSIKGPHMPSNVTQVMFFQQKAWGHLSCSLITVSPLVFFHSLSFLLCYFLHLETEVHQCLFSLIVFMFSGYKTRLLEYPLIPIVISNFPWPIFAHLHYAFP